MLVQLLQVVVNQEALVDFALVVARLLLEECKLVEHLEDSDQVQVQAQELGHQWDQVEGKWEEGLEDSDQVQAQELGHQWDQVQDKWEEGLEDSDQVQAQEVAHKWEEDPGDLAQVV